MEILELISCVVRWTHIDSRWWLHTPSSFRRPLRSSLESWASTLCRVEDSPVLCRYLDKQIHSVLLCSVNVCCQLLLFDGSRHERVMQCWIDFISVALARWRHWKCGYMHNFRLQQSINCLPQLLDCTNFVVRRTSFLRQKSKLKTQHTTFQPVHHRWKAGVITTRPPMSPTLC